MFLLTFTLNWVLNILEVQKVGGSVQLRVKHQYSYDLYVYIF